MADGGRGLRPFIAPDDGGNRHEKDGIDEGIAPEERRRVSYQQMIQERGQNHHPIDQRYDEQRACILLEMGAKIEFGLTPRDYRNHRGRS